MVVIGAMKRVWEWAAGGVVDGLNGVTPAAAAAPYTTSEGWYDATVAGQKLL